MDLLSTGTMLVAAVCIMVGALAKGLVGLGMPLVALPLLTYLMPVRDAVCVMAVPILITNLYQMCESGTPRRALHRFWPFLLTLAGGISLGAHFLTSLNGSLLKLILGTLVIVFAVGGLLDVPIVVKSEHEKWLGPVAGLAVGLLGGIAGLWGPPLAVYLISLRLQKSEFISALGSAFSVGSVALLLSLVAYGSFGERELFYSTLALIPALAGLLLGQWGRLSIPQEAFRKVILLILVITGLNLIYRAAAH